MTLVLSKGIQFYVFQVVLFIFVKDDGGMWMWMCSSSRFWNDYME